MCDLMFATGRVWSGATAREVALQVFKAGAKAGVYVFEAPDGTAIYVGKSENELGSRIERHEYIRCSRVWALESTCTSVAEVQLIAVLLPQTNRETKSCPGNFPRPKVGELLLMPTKG